MASKLGYNAFTVQESVNMDAFSDFNYEEIDLSSAGAVSVTAITSANPAKKVVIYNEPVAAGTLESDDVITLTINSKVAKISRDHLPFTISGLLITSLTLTNSDPEGTEGLAVLSFH